MNRNFKAWGALLAVALLGVSVGAAAQPRKEIREDRKEKREDRKEIREDKKELREDIKDGASRKEIREDKKELAEDKKELREDRKETREDRKEWREDRRERRNTHLKELKAKWGDALKKPAAKEELRTHARRMARLAHARKVAEEAGKKELVARIDKLLEKEKTRHQNAMDKLKGGTP